MTQKLKLKNLHKLIPLAIFLLLALLLVGLFFKATSLSSKKSITRLDVLTFNVPGDWFIYKQNKTYDFDMGMFKNNSEKEELLCNINVVTTKLNRNTTFEQFTQTSMGGKLFLDSHQDTNFHGQNAWRGTYVFPALKIADPAQNDRILFIYKGVYTDITLSYSQKTSLDIQKRCKLDFDNFSERIILN